MKLLKYLFLSLVILVISSTTLFSQQEEETTKVDLINSNTLEYSKRYNKDVQRLIGNVIFKLDSTYLYCDSAYNYNDIQRIDAFSNVHIKQGDTLDIYGDTLIFSGETNLAELHNNVEMIDKEIILTTDNLTYDLNTEIADYYNGGKIVDTRNQLTSVTGRYFSAEKEFFFKDSVVFTNPQYVMNSDTLMYNTKTEIAYFYGPTTINSEENLIYCENGWNDSKNNISQFKKNAYLVNKEDGRTLRGDSLYYNRTKGIGKAFNNVSIEDTLENITITGDFGRYNEFEKISFVTGKALLTQAQDEDTLFLHADTLKAINDTIDSNRVLFAYRKVKFYKSDLQGMCDSLTYLFADSLIEMNYNPVLWTEEHQLFADTIKIKTGDNRIQSLHLFNTSFIISMDDTAKFNQIKGDRITAYFKDNELKRIFVDDRSQTVYYMRDENEHLVGVNTSLSEDLMILVEDNEIQTITFIKKPDGILYPVNKLPPEKQKLKGFKWLDKHRPHNKKEIFNWYPLDKE